ncbi:hypothetical protein AVEN_156638-1 [Araneus ventricosus]|uniref:Uncharacterized protein n=1 Tax=Araneus ventricosus TaxID=182803 RepID=A0A4Y2ML52_ARAVE|nr:hypothetical protein AVEN_156638-1 [Araneus ventricosus]
MICSHGIYITVTVNELPRLHLHLSSPKWWSWRQQSEIESGVLIAISGRGPTSPAGGTLRIQSGGNSTPLHIYAYKESENPPTYPTTFHPRTRGAAQLDKILAKKAVFCITSVNAFEDIIKVVLCIWTEILHE